MIKKLIIMGLATLMAVFATAATLRFRRRRGKRYAGGDF